MLSFNETRLGSLTAAEAELCGGGSLSDRWKAWHVKIVKEFGITAVKTIMLKGADNLTAEHLASKIIPKLSLPGGIIIGFLVRRMVKRLVIIVCRWGIKRLREWALSAKLGSGPANDQLAAMLLEFQQYELDDNAKVMLASSPGRKFA